MVSCARQTVSGPQDAHDNLGQGPGVGEPQGEMVKTGGIAQVLSGRGAPDVEGHVMVVIAGGEEYRCIVLLRD